MLKKIHDVDVVDEAGGDESFTSPFSANYHEDLD